MAQAGDSGHSRRKKAFDRIRYKSDGSGRYGFACLGWLLLMVVVQFGWETPILGLIAYSAVAWALFAISKLFYEFKTNTKPKTVDRVPVRTWSAPPGPRPFRSSRR